MPPWTIATRVALPLVFLVVACSSSDTPTNQNGTVPATADVSVGNNFFNPNSVTVAVGGTVTWNWNSGAVTHNVTFQTAGAPADIGNTSTGSFPRTFPSAGTFQYECTLHPGMSGSVTAQ